MMGESSGVWMCNCGAAFTTYEERAKHSCYITISEFRSWLVSLRKDNVICYLPGEFPGYTSARNAALDKLSSEDWDEATIYQKFSKLDLEDCFE